MGIVVSLQVSIVAEPVPQLKYDPPQLKYDPPPHTKKDKYPVGRPIRVNTKYLFVCSFVE